MTGQSSAGLRVLAATTMLISACAPDPTAVETPSAEAGSTTTSTLVTSTVPATTVAAIESVTSTTSGPGTVAIEDSLGVWSVVAGPTPSLRGGAVASGDLTAAVIDTELGTAVVMGERDGEVRQVHTPGFRWILQELLFVDQVLVDVVNDESTGQARLYRLAATSDPVLIEEWGSDVGHIPEMAASGSTLWYTTRHEPDVVCITELDMVSGSTRDILCGERGVDIGRLAASGEYLSFVERDRSECRQLMRLIPDSGDPPELVSGDACVFDGVAGGDIVAWVGNPKPHSPQYVDYSALPATALNNGTAVDLGIVVTASLAICDNALYWLTEADGETPREIRTWRPNEPIQVLYRSPDEGTGRTDASRPSCTADGQVLIKRAGWQAGAWNELLILGAHDWVIDLSLAEVVAEPHPQQYLAALAVSPELADWAKTQTDEQLLEYANTICDELDSQTDHGRYNYMSSVDTETRWMETFSLQKLELWFWRQTATEHICPRYYPITIGN